MKLFHVRCRADDRNHSVGTLRQQAQPPCRMRCAIRSPGKIYRNQTQHPASRRTAKSAIHPSRWLSMTLNANDQNQPVCAADLFSEPTAYANSAGFSCYLALCLSCTTSHCTCRLRISNSHFNSVLRWIACSGVALCQLKWHRKHCRVFGEVRICWHFGQRLMSTASGLSLSTRLRTLRRYTHNPAASSSLPRSASDSLNGPKLLTKYRVKAGLLISVAAVSVMHSYFPTRCSNPVISSG